MDINFTSIVQLTKLFTTQDCLQNSTKQGEFHLVNINSIGGSQALSQWSDYGASKFALRGLSQALRFEFEEQLPNIVMTNIYPYYINTGMFKGF